MKRRIATGLFVVGIALVEIAARLAAAHGEENPTSLEVWLTSTELDGDQRVPVVRVTNDSLGNGADPLR